MKGLKRVEDMLDTFLKNEHLSKEARFCYEACMVKVQDEIAEEEKTESALAVSNRWQEKEIAKLKTELKYYTNKIDWQKMYNSEKMTKLEYLGNWNKLKEELALKDKENLVFKTALVLMAEDLRVSLSLVNCIPKKCECSKCRFVSVCSLKSETVINHCIDQAREELK